MQNLKLKAVLDILFLGERLSPIETRHDVDTTERTVQRYPLNFGTNFGTDEDVFIKISLIFRQVPSYPSRCQKAETSGRPALVCHSYSYLTHQIMTSWNGNFSRFWTFVRRIHRSAVIITKASDAKLWCILWYAPERRTEKRLETSVIWDTIVFIMTSL